MLLRLGHARLAVVAPFELLKVLSCSLEPARILRLKPGNGVVALFLLTVLLPAALLAFLGFRAFRQERRLADHQVRDRLERVAESAARNLEEELREWQSATEAIRPDRTRSIEELPARMRDAVPEPDSAAVVLPGQRCSRRFQKPNRYTTFFRGLGHGDLSGWRFAVPPGALRLAELESSRKRP
ncbi:MAG TPA: hypothetical protein VLE22_08465 [Bryobacteraceae bacterium]|nr:hypothetical protein [Bryobacteraceae bacterium]